MKTRGTPFVLPSGGLQNAIRVLFAALWLALAVTALGCSTDFFDDFASGDVECFSSFPTFKKAMERAGKKPPPTEQWHHIVNQNPTNTRRFPKRLHCTDNVIAIPTQIHRKISGHYSSKPDWAKGKTVRDVISAKSWDEQHSYGLRVLSDYGISP